MDASVAESLAVRSPDGAAGYGTSSPFLGAGFLAEPLVLATPYETPAQVGLVSPFAEALVAEAGEEEGLVEELFGELEDESFDDAVEALVDEAAALHLSSPWSPESETGSPLVDAWAARLTVDAQRLLERLDEAFADRTLESITDEEIDVAGSRILVDPISLAGEQLFGGLLRKVKSGLSTVRRAATKAAGAGLGMLAKFTSLGQITGILRKLVGPLVERVVNSAINRLPASVQGYARTLATKLRGRVSAAAGVGGEAESEALEGSARQIAADFDRQLAEALTVGSDAALLELFATAAEAAVRSPEDPMASLDEARARLADELAEARAGEPPVVQLEQFIPAVMAAMPLVRTAVRVIGRNRVKGLIAAPLATFVAPFIGRQAARSLAPHIADAGMKLLRLEHEDPTTLATEALVTTVEETVRQVLSLPEESLADDLRLAAEVQEAFTEAAGRYLPGQVLRADLDIGEREREGGWVMMPRSAGPHYRYRAYTGPSRVLLSRPVARAVVYPDGETLEERLLDAGATAWPVEADVQLFEALPGTRFGHLVAGTDREHLETPGDTVVAPTAEDFGELTPEVAGLVLGRPDLGRRVPGGYGREPRPGQRLFRVVPAGRVPAGRPRRVRRIGLRLDVAGARPVLRVHLRIGERAAHTMAGQLDRRAYTQVVATLRRLLGPEARRAVARRLGRLRALDALGAMPEGRRAALAEALAEGMLTAVAKGLPAAGAAIATAAKDPATGLTLTFAFTFADRSALLRDAPGAPAMTIRPGYRHD